jgi:hypothetical protein
MREHLSAEILERFHLQSLSAEDRRTIYNHLRGCEPCSERIVDRRVEAIVLRRIHNHLIPEDVSYHLDFELIEGYVENSLDNLDLALVLMHLEVCELCATEVTDFRASLVTMRESSVPQRRQIDLWSLRDRFLGLSPLGTQPRFAPIAIAALVVMSAVAFIMWQKTWSVQRSHQELAKQPTPLPVQSPQQENVLRSGGGPAPNPSPRPIESQTHTKLTKSLGEPAAELVALSDGPRRITLHKSGYISGLSDLSREGQQIVRETLLAGALQRPAILDDLSGTQSALRGNSGSQETLTLLSPGNTVVIEDRPLFKWTPLKNASSYQVQVGDTSFRKAAGSEELPATTTEWRPERPLKRGMIYTWLVSAVRDGVEVRTAASPSEMKFKVLAEEKVKELERLSRSRSHLALGVFYAREGMLTEAEREFHMLVKENPRSSVARKLLKQIRSWGKR